MRLSPLASYNSYSPHPSTTAPQPVYQKVVDLTFAGVEVGHDVHLSTINSATGLVAASAAVLGAAQLTSPLLEVKVEGLSNLALSGSMLAGMGHHGGPLAVGLACTHAALDIGLACYEVHHHSYRQAFFHACKGVAVLGSVAFPSVAPALHLTLLGAMAAQAFF